MSSEPKQTPDTEPPDTGTTDTRSPDDGVEAFPDLPEDPKSRAQRRAERKAEKAAAKARSIADGSRRRSNRHSLGSLALATAVAALTAAIVCLAYFGYVGFNAYFGTGGQAATLRDESVDVAEQAIINIINVDADDIDGWERRIDSSLTGGALQQVKDGTLETLKKEIADGSRSQHARLTGEIRRAACTEVNVAENRATVLVFSSSTAYAGKNEQGEEVTTEIAQMEFLVSVVEVGGVRKVDNIVPLMQIPIEEGSGSSAGAKGSGGSAGAGRGAGGSSSGGGR